MVAGSGVQLKPSGPGYTAERMPVSVSILSIKAGVARHVPPSPLQNEPPKLARHASCLRVATTKPYGDRPPCRDAQTPCMPRTAPARHERWWVGVSRTARSFCVLHFGPLDDDMLRRWYLEAGFEPCQEQCASFLSSS
ncbi:hypothetical protein GQ55_9G491300 [Panicum hallii var. hallii]|uniref:Uncharacterized protein n=1 Tax=Panicum hallii var. hallii TaxID=1504633 RepID=A0A2T7CD69_9POAL|nr:hypothetical protein GQ55_9G491300 [Panicum hallii var. hallii]